MRAVSALLTRRQWQADTCASAMSSRSAGDVGTLPITTRSSMVAHLFCTTRPSLSYFFATNFASS